MQDCLDTDSDAIDEDGPGEIDTRPSIERPITLTQAYESIGARYAHRSMRFFTRFVRSHYRMQWYHRQMCDALDEMLKGNIKRLMIFTPPQHGKTEIVSRCFPAFALGRNPDLMFAGCSHTADLASRFNRDVQRIIDSDIYRRVFPDSQLSSKNVVSNSQGNYLRNSDAFEIVGHRGRYESVGIGGPLTGKTVDIGVIDDPVKDAVESASPVSRARLWEWYTDVFSTRLNNGSRVLLIMTRWHEDDLAGRILAAEGDKWKVLRFRALKEEGDSDEDPRMIGDALWPEKHNKESILDQKARSQRTYDALYQQRPAPSEGGIIKTDWWKLWDRLPEKFDRVLTSWDLTFKDVGTSWVVGQAWGKVGANLYMIDQVRGKWDFPESVRQIKAFRARHPEATETLIEDKANGPAAIATLRNEVSGIIPINPKGDKEARVGAISYHIESGNVYIPARATWKDEFMHECNVFPNGTNDDMVDTMSQAINRLTGSAPQLMML